MEERPLPLIFNCDDLVFQFGDFYEDNVDDTVELNTYERMGLGNPIGDAIGILTSGDTSSRQNK